MISSNSTRDSRPGRSGVSPVFSNKNPAAAKGRKAPSRKSTRRMTAAEITEWGNRRPTSAERRKALDASIQDGAYAVGPPNRLVKKNPVETVSSCSRIIDFFAHIEEPFHSDALEAAKGDILHLVVDALQHVERTISVYWAKQSAAAREVKP